MYVFAYKYCTYIIYNVISSVDKNCDVRIEKAQKEVKQNNIAGIPLKKKKIKN